MMEKLEESLFGQAVPLLPRRESVRVITFYSYKGGVGRTMALANVAYRLAHRHALRVIAVDWDLEAPGLPRFFDLTSEELAETPGVLDFMIEWKDGVGTKAGDPPDARNYLIPVTRPPYKPDNGSLAIMSAGRQDGHYDQRLASLDWRIFYKDRSGAIAVERLRRQLLEEADVVLVDSRTGLTDTGGICTIQLPDGVILMAAPNEQSILGIEGAACAIRDPEAKRAGRNPPKVWVSLCRVPYLEEQPLTETWIEAHRAWFEAGIERGLWARVDHPRGLGSHTLMQRARWGLGEQLLHKANGFDSEDPLAKAFDALAATLLFEHGEYAEPEVRSEEEEQERKKHEEKARRESVELAERRRDIVGLARELYELGVFYRNEYRLEEARAVLERAAGILMAGDNSEAYRYVQVVLGHIHLEQRRSEDARNIAERVMESSREIGDERNEDEAIDLLARIAERQSDLSSAETWYRRRLRFHEKPGDEYYAGHIYGQLGHLASQQRRFEDAGRWLIKSAEAFKTWNASQRLQQTQANFRELYRQAPAADQAKLRDLWEAAGLGKLPVSAESS